MSTNSHEILFLSTHCPMGYIQVGHGKVEVGSTGVAVLLIVLLLSTLHRDLMTSASQAAPTLNIPDLVINCYSLLIKFVV